MFVSTRCGCDLKIFERRKSKKEVEVSNMYLSVLSNKSRNGSPRSSNATPKGSPRWSTAAVAEQPPVVATTGTEDGIRDVEPVVSDRTSVDTAIHQHPEDPVSAISNGNESSQLNGQHQPDDAHEDTRLSIASLEYGRDSIPPSRAPPVLTSPRLDIDTESIYETRYDTESEYGGSDLFNSRQAYDSTSLMPLPESPSAASDGGVIGSFGLSVRERLRQRLNKA